MDKMFGLWQKIFHRFVFAVVALLLYMLQCSLCICLMNYGVCVCYSLRLSDVSRLSTLVNMTAADLADGIADNGHNYALVHASSGLTLAHSLRELTGGLTQVRHFT